MHISNIVFYAMLFFLFGVAAYSVSGSWWAVMIFLMLCASIIGLVRGMGRLGSGKGLFSLRFSGLLLAMSFFGASYFAIFTHLGNRGFTVPVGQRIEFAGIINDYPESKNGSMHLVVRVSGEWSGELLVIAERYPEYLYGDEVLLGGIVQNPRPEEYAQYLKKQNVYGVMYYPDVRILSQGNGSSIKAMLFSVRSSFGSRIERALPFLEAAFMNGLLLGERASFSKEFGESMRLSGTTHLVALSGYNISIIAASISALLLFLGLNKKPAFWASVFVIIGFVIMTGAQASVVRAAIMGIILLIAGHTGKLHNIKNAIMFAAVSMVLINPYVLRYDAGFQLSFLALLGIVYLMPAIVNALDIKQTKSFLSWREHALTTLSAQLFVIPVVFYHFDSFSLISFLSNILVLEAIPMTMFFGFVAGVLGYVSVICSRLLALIALVLLRYEIFIIETTAKISIPIIWDKIPVIVVVAYYAIGALFIKKYYRLAT